MADRSVFYGHGAYVATLVGDTQCKWFPDDPKSLGWDPAKQIGVDLAKSPAAVRSGAIKSVAIDVDDHAVYGGLTKIGPDFPLGETIGACWITEAALKRETGLAPFATPPTDCRAYELTHVLYWDGPLAGCRFQGTYAEIQNLQGTVALCTIWHPGTSLQPNASPAGTWWIDLAHAHPVEAGFTEIGPAPLPQKGALFLDLRIAGSIGLLGPKLPPSSGDDTFPAPPSGTP